MCCLFGLHGGAAAVPATFWLLDASHSLEAQSHHNPDGAGIGVFEADGTAHVPSGHSTTIRVVAKRPAPGRCRRRQARLAHHRPSFDPSRKS